MMDQRTRAPRESIHSEGCRRLSMCMHRERTNSLCLARNSTDAAQFLDTTPNIFHIGTLYPRRPSFRNSHNDGNSKNRRHVDRRKVMNDAKAVNSSSFDRNRRKRRRKWRSKYPRGMLATQSRRVFSVESGHRRSPPVASLTFLISQDLLEGWR